MQTKIDFTAPDYVAILKERQDRLVMIRKNPKKRNGMLAHYRKGGAQGCIDFIEDWMFTYDPRREIQWLPFCLFPKQKEFMYWLHDHFISKDDGLVEKSRDVGLTWMCMAFSIWLWRFTESKIGFGSRKEALVDHLGDPDSIFEKGRMILSHFPREILPKKFDLAKHAGFLKIINPQTGAAITGEAGDNIGRGGRNTIYFKDEAAFYERPMRIEAALSQNSDVKIDLSTPNGTGNPFHNKRQSYVEEDIFVFDWRDDPRKTPEWYAEQERKLDPIILAQEVNRDYGASVEGVVIPLRWVKAAINLDLPANGSTEAGLDVADEGKDQNALVIRKGVVVRFIDSWHKGNTTQTTQKAAFICREHRCHSLRYDKIGVGAGVKGELSNAGYADIIPVPINSSSSPTPGWYSEEKKNEDMFLNYRAQMWWGLRRRFEKTYEYVTEGREYPADELISIPDDRELQNEISSPKYKFSGAGRVQIESKKDMARRGIKSPNKADALAICFGPVRIKRAGSWGNRERKAA